MWALAVTQLMCVLRIASKTKSFKPILDSMDIPTLSVFDIGEFRDKGKKRICENYQATLDVSKKEWDDLPGQVEDAINFLKKHAPELKKIFECIDGIDWGLDFPIYSILDDTWVTQGIKFPKELVSIAGELNIDIGMTLYAKDLFDENS